MIKHRLSKIKPRGLMNLTFFSILMLSLASCFEDNTIDSVSPVLYITGPNTITPESTESYSIGGEGATVTWTVEPAASASISGNGNTVDITFNGVGDYTLTASSGGLTGMYNVKSSAADLAVEVDQAITKNGNEATIKLTFNAAISGTPVLAISDTLANGSDGVATGALSALTRETASTFTAIYTGGAGNGTVAALLTGVTATEAFGGTSMDSQVLEIVTLDNVSPTGTAEFSVADAKDGTEVTLTVTFSEDVKPVADMDTLLVGISGGGVLAVTADTLSATSDAKVWTLNYLTNGNGNGTLTAILDAMSVQDLAGNPIVFVTGSSAISASLNIDNTAPTVTSTLAGQVSQLSGTHTVELTVADNESWLFLAPFIGNDGVTVITPDAPTTSAEFGGGGVGPQSIELVPNTYEVYFIAIDDAGNESAITSAGSFIVTD